MIVTTNHANHIITNHTAACFSTDIHFFCFHSSHAAVTIWNHHHKHNTNAINDNIPSTRLMKFLITSIRVQFLFSHVQIVFIHIACTVETHQEYKLTVVLLLLKSQSVTVA